jgi:hypothetical protein
MDITCRYFDHAATDEADFPCWLKSEDPAEITAHYRVAVKVVRRVARELGYAIGEHGTFVRDLDVIAAPWVEDVAEPRVLLRAVSMALIGLEWEVTSMNAARKPHNRQGTVFAIGRRAYLDISIMALPQHVA